MADASGANTASASASAAHSTQCCVCFGDMTTTKNKSVTCGHCHTVACKSCVRQYILANNQDAQCMTCHHIFSRQFMVATLSAAFVNGPYKKHFEQILFERQLALMPATQPIAERTLEEMQWNAVRYNALVARKQAKAVMVRARADLDEAKRQPTVDSNSTVYECVVQTRCLRAFDDARQAYERARQNAIAQRDIYYNRLHARDQRDQFATAQAAVQGAAPARVFTHKCPSETCKGFLSTQWKCGLCQQFSCKDCFELIGQHADIAAHKCNEEHLASAALIRSETKPCPKCATRISKISGCDQMYCTQCHTAFSWRTGAVESGVIHNPHYFEHLRRTQGTVPRQPGDIPGGVHCVQHIDIGLLSRIFRDPQHAAFYNSLWDLFGQFFHIQQVEVAMRTNRFADQSRQLRVDYLVNKLTKEQFQSQLVRIHKLNERYTEERHVFETVEQVTLDFYRRILAARDLTAVLTACEVESRELLAYLNEVLADIGQLYNCQRVQFAPDWRTFHVAKWAETKSGDKRKASDTTSPEPAAKQPTL